MSAKFCLLLLFCFFCLSASFGQAGASELKNQRITVKMERMPFGIVLGYLREKYDVPIGFEESIRDRNNSEFSFSSNSPGVAKYKLENIDGVFKVTVLPNQKTPLYPVTIACENERLEIVLNRIVKQVKNYKWEINDGVVNIYPIRERDKRFKQLLALKVKKFIFQKGDTISDITKSIKLLPEFSAFAAENNFRFNGGRSGMESVLREQYGRTVNQGMDFSNLTFRDLLNRVTKIKRGAWILKWRFISQKTGEEFIDIDI
jgi:hypothetical protein